MNYVTPPDRKYVRPTRPFDYLYDHVHTISSQRDFYKNAAMGSRFGAQIKLRPIYKTMFSELRRDRRMEACFTVPKPNVLQNFMPQYKIGGKPFQPLDCGPAYSRPVDPAGADRANFVIKYEPETYFMSRPALGYNLEDELKRNREKALRKSKFISRGAQTDYRESETQTDPYSPPFELSSPDAYPKVLALIKLTWGKGLPATLDDIITIERALTRRLLELGTRNLDDEADFEKRVKLMEELEAQQWADREKELTRIMRHKMILVLRRLEELKAKIANEHTNRLEKTYEMAKVKNYRTLAQVKHDYMREIRKLYVKYYIEPRPNRRNVVKEYSRFKKETYVPKIKKGPTLDQLYKPPFVNFDITPGYDEFQNLTTSEDFIKKELQFDMEAFGARMKSKCYRPPARDLRMAKKLEDIFNTFKAETMKKDIPDDLTIMKQMMMNTIRRMTTPTSEESDAVQEQKEQAVITLQRVIRGRVLQSAMRDEIKNNMRMILEMKSLYKQDPHGIQRTAAEMAAMEALYKEREVQEEHKNEVTEITDQLEGETLGRMIDFLDREMVRLLDERKVHALVLLAERERRMKEAIEGGNRAREEACRRQNDEIFRHVVGIHQSTVDIYLEDMYLESIGRVADDESRLYVTDLARTLNEAAYLMDKNSSGEMAQEEMAADLVHSFLMPELNRVFQRQRLDALKARYLRAGFQVTEATMSSTGVVRQILDEIQSSVADHMEAGSAAVDGTQLALDSMIREAVKLCMERTHSRHKNVPDTPSTTVEPAEEGTEEYKQYLRSFLPPEKTDEMIKAISTAEVPAAEHVSTSERAILEMPQYDHLKVLLGEKSLELAHEAEIGSKVKGIWHQATMAVGEIFQETNDCVQSLHHCEEYRGEDDESPDDLEDDPDADDNCPIDKCPPRSHC